jgi:hypothetical protein
MVAENGLQIARSQADQLDLLKTVAEKCSWHGLTQKKNNLSQ